MNVRVALLQIASQHTKSGQRGVAGCPGIPGRIKSVWVAGSSRNTHAATNVFGNHGPNFYKDFSVILIYEKILNPIE